MRNTNVNEKNVATVGIPVMPDREKYIDRCVESILFQTFSYPYEIIIAQHPGFIYKLKHAHIPENIKITIITSGKSLSSKRNGIIEHASGEYIVNIDDDVIAEPDWLEQLMKAVLDNNYDIFWGLAKPLYEKEFPESLDPFEMYIGGFHIDRRGNLRRKGIIGCNFGFKKGLPHKRGKFVEAIGRGARVSCGEEILFLAECINPNKGLIEKSVVHHHIQKERISFSYVVKNRISNVKAKIYINYLLGGSNRRILVDRITSLIKAFRPAKSYLRRIILEFCLLLSALYTMLNILINRNSIRKGFL